MISERETAAFEAGIKLGALYHQFVGTPISQETAEYVEKAIESAVRLQPFVEEIEVHLNREDMVSNRFGYSELSGRMYRVRIKTKVGGSSCVAELELEDQYPMMKIVDMHEED